MKFSLIFPVYFAITYIVLMNVNLKNYSELNSWHGKYYDWNTISSSISKHMPSTSNVLKEMLNQKVQ